MHYKFQAILLFLMISVSSFRKAPQKDFYQIQVYHLKSNEQASMMDDYLKNAYIPALHRSGIKKIGVFKPIANDTAVDKLIYVIIPFASAEAWSNITAKLEKDGSYINASKPFMEAASDKAPYVRMESILLEAFSGQPNLVLPKTKNTDRVFELRSYESPTAHLQKKKMAMFNTGGEIEIFNRLGFNPVFYAKVVSGSHMPNFMYMPIFESVAQNKEQWKKFGNDPVWKDISNRPENENKVSVSHIDSILMHATDYSDY